MKAFFSIYSLYKWDGKLQIIELISYIIFVTWNLPIRANSIVIFINRDKNIRMIRKIKKSIDSVHLWNTPKVYVYKEYSLCFATTPWDYKFNWICLISTILTLPKLSKCIYYYVMNGRRLRSTRPYVLHACQHKIIL